MLLLVHTLIISTNKKIGRDQLLVLLINLSIAFFCSSVAKQSPKQLISRANPDSIFISKPLFIAVLINEMAAGLFKAIPLASAMLCALSVFSGKI